MKLPAPRLRRACVWPASPPKNSKPPPWGWACCCRCAGNRRLPRCPMYCGAVRRSTPAWTRSAARWKAFMACASSLRCARGGKHLPSGWSPTWLTKPTAGTGWPPARRRCCCPSWMNRIWKTGSSRPFPSAARPKTSPTASRRTAMTCAPGRCAAFGSWCARTKPMAKTSLAR